MTNPSDDQNAFRKLQAAFALRGHTLYRQTSEGSSGLCAARWGLVGVLPASEDARHVLAQIGGKL